MAATNVSLKLFIDKKKRRVLSAEADNKFVDFLLSIFILPVGVVTRLLKDGGGVVGCLPSLYQSMKNLSVTYIKPDKNKLFLLEPKLVMPGAELPLLLPNVGSTFSQLYRCPYTYSNCLSVVAIDVGTICPSCKSKMDQNVKCVDPTSATRAASSAGEEGYVIGTVAYMVMDDLEVKPSSSSFLVTLLTKFDVKDVGDIEEKVVDLGMDEGVNLLKASLQSKTVLTDIFLPAEMIKIEESIKNEQIGIIKTDESIKNDEYVWN